MLGPLSQDMLFEHLGVQSVQGAANGYHSCIFAYGQTGSAKSNSKI